MKRILPYCILGAIACLIVNSFMSCAVKSASDPLQDSLEEDTVDTIAIETETAMDSSKYASVSVVMSLPVGGDEVSKSIRQQLLRIMASQVYKDADYGGEGNISGAAFDGDPKNLKGICQFYSKAVFDIVEKESKKEAESTAEYIYDDESLTEADRQSQLSNIPSYEEDVKLEKTDETASYIVFCESSFGYRGGAHGGMAGYGYIIFDKATGKQVTSLLKPGAAKGMQKLLKAGLKSYFNENGEDVKTDQQLMECLMIEGSRIPLPQGHGISLTKNGLLFVYAQYEIAAYAAGMPSFVIPYDKVKTYLTDDAKAVLGLDENN